jgi:hypothetical protein
VAAPGPVGVVGQALVGQIDYDGQTGVLGPGLEGPPDEQLKILRGKNFGHDGINSGWEHPKIRFAVYRTQFMHYCSG